MFWLKLELIVRGWSISLFRENFDDFGVHFFFK
jgi:hypothetical protein